MMKECPFNSRNKCYIWVDYQVTCAALQEAEALLTKKSTISAYENDKIDIKISILKQIAALLGTTVAYLADGEKTEIGEDVMQVALLLQGMQNEELRKVAMEQVKLLAGVK